MQSSDWHTARKMAYICDPDAKRRESWALLLNAAATPRNGRTQELASALHRLYRCLLAPSKLLGTFIRKESHRRDGMLPFVEGAS